jgi:ribonuclease HII
MAWIIGIDEAGYGPNLGPFVMTSVECQVPDESVGSNLWSLLSRAVRPSCVPADDRLLIDDSKVLFSQTKGLSGLERGVHATLGCVGQLRFHQWLADRCADGSQELVAEPWYEGDSSIPAAAGLEQVLELNARFSDACTEAGISGFRARCVVLCAPRFNSLTQSGGSKGAVLAHALAVLLKKAEAETSSGPAHFFVDKHGGRNTYAAFIQHALPDGVVVARLESMERSVYRVHGFDRCVEMTFQPRADAEHFCVALASMVSKYIRELCMAEFNRFWTGRIPGLRPTAGYPGDAARFWAAIQPTVKKMGLSEACVWRSR